MDKKRGVETPETKVPYKAVNFYELSDAEKQVLESRLASNHGNAIALVHPYYENSEPGMQIIKRHFQIEKPLEEVRKQFEAMLKNVSADGPPIFVLEGAKTTTQAVEQAQKYLTEIGSNVYIIPTYPSWPEPRGSYQAMQSQDIREFEARQDDHFDELGFALKKLGVVKMYFAGMNFAIDKNNEGLDAGCVLSAMEALKAYIPQVKLAAFTWPSSRETIKKDPYKMDEYIEYI